MFTENRIIFLKCLLPLLSFCLLMGVFLWPKVSLEDISPIKPIPLEVNQANALCFSSADKKNRPFLIKSQSGQYLASKDILLKKLEIILHLEDGGEITLQGDQGTYHHQHKKMDLEGNVRLTHSNGTQFDTTTATIDLEKGTAQNNAHLKGRCRNSRIEAQGFKILEQGQQIVFLGQPQITTYH